MLKRTEPITARVEPAKPLHHPDTITKSNLALLVVTIEKLMQRDPCQHARDAIYEINRLTEADADAYAAIERARHTLPSPAAGGTEG
jgi:hypothetical protein